MKGIDRQFLGFRRNHFKNTVHSIVFSSSQRSPSPGPNHTSSSNASTATVVPQNPSARPAFSLTPTLAAHFNENLIKHVQGWPADHAEKQVCYMIMFLNLCMITEFCFEKIWSTEFKLYLK